MTDRVDIPEPDRIRDAPHPRHTRRLFGQQKAGAEFLAALNSHRLHHAWLISGPVGVGKATLAWKIARLLLTETEPDLISAPAQNALETPGDTPLARRLAALAEPRLCLCRRPWDQTRERLKQDITVEEVRKIRGFFQLSAADGGRRVVIIDPAEDMNPSAANALLKILEEPPDNTVLLLISHRPMRLLPTIRSRCRTLKCQPLGAEDMQAALKGAGVDPGASPDAVSALAFGSVGEAIRLTAEDGLTRYGNLVDLIGGARAMDRATAVQIAESCVGKQGVDRYDLTVSLIHRLLYRLALSGANPQLVQTISEREQALFAGLSRTVTSAQRWATLAQSLAERAAHARAVHLDPASVIIDMLVKIDQTAARERAA